MIENKKKLRLNAPFMNKMLRLYLVIYPNWRLMRTLETLQSKPTEEQRSSRTDSYLHDNKPK